MDFSDQHKMKQWSLCFKVTTVHKSTTYNNKLYNIQQSIQNQTSAPARCSPAIRGQLNLCTAPRLPFQGQHLQWRLKSIFCLVWPWTLTYWPQSWSFHALARWPLVPICIKSVQSFSKYRPDKFGDRRMDGQTIKQVKNTLPLSVSLAWWSHYESWQFQ